MSAVRRVLAAAATVLAAAGPAWSAGFIDPISRPAQPSPLAPRSLMQAVAQAGSSLVAVGQRGQIVVSNDNGANWKQSAVPVSSDLTAVYFVDDRRGWAVGHDGVILASGDGGQTWTLQLDGQRANALLIEHMEQQVAQPGVTDETKRLLEDARSFEKQGADKPFLDVWFADADNGFAVGAYNLILRTGDGGRTWTPWFDRTENPQLFHLYSIRPAAGGLYIAGEGGLLLRLDETAKRFRAQKVGYTGSFFGVTGGKDYALVFGMRGNAFRSDDAGATWTKIDVGLPGSLVSATTTDQGMLFVADVGGRIAGSADGGRTFRVLPVKNTMPLAGIASAGPGRLALAGVRGVLVAEFTAR
jgi:photosystem II stability/assembly factor-like uncharacterized protein